MNTYKKITQPSPALKGRSEGQADIKEVKSCIHLAQIPR